MPFIKHWCFGVLLILITHSNSVVAGVIYNWVNFEPNEVAGPIVASIEINTNFWEMGGVLNWSISSSPFPPIAVSSAPIQNLTFFTTASEIDPIDLFNEGVSTCIQVYDTTTCDLNGLSYDEQVLWPLTSVDLNLSFVGSRMTGSMYVNDGSSDFRMNGDGVWEVTRLGSDFGSGGESCFMPGVCNGGTGAWVIDPRTIPIAVTSPATILLLGIGFMVIGWVQRQKLIREKDRGGSAI